MKASMLDTKIERMSVKVGETILSHSVDGYHPKIANQWGYVAGMALAAIDKLGDWTGEAKYHEFVKRHMDVFVQEDGSIHGYKLEDYNLDHINKGKNLLRLWRETGESKYEKAARLLITQLAGQPRTDEGGFWHKKIYPFQMWLDGLYMSSPYMAEYARTFDDSSWFDETAHQLLLVERRTRNPQTGLLHHAWDETKEQRWCDSFGTGRSRHVWGRAMGWYAMALVDALEHFPIGHAKRGQLMGIFERMANSVVRAQDQDSGLWYQVMDCNGQQGNYLEASGSCMLTYAIAKGIRLNYLAEIDRSVVERAYEGILQRFVTEDEQGVHLHSICHGAGLGGRKYRDGSYAYYLSEAVVSDVLMGVAPLLLASVEMEKLREQSA
ncbi:glycoside hydrolase family 105 protein [Paenibacillus sp. GCM10023248]|uniref:glycoside hydrolase family 88/105 protein n=1 Tax=Bacillales TaxID=1385 RepID=UPI002378A6DD|nr:MULTISPECIES: glycoside hydrolase family 88 protein [Bacillales]MDD9271619.1 glycoside hydrolase family 88 protein [Paenibacillus sp. MAHUQ-63]MDR6884025.1 unsaturated rhamnogalacturonyl hydrolase [Bacillus sp. 3255]